MCFELQTVLDELAQLKRDIECIKNGDCCNGGGGVNIYNTSDTILTNREATLTDTLKFLAQDTTVLNTFWEAGDVALSQNIEGRMAIGTDPVAQVKLVVRSFNELNDFSSILLRTEDSAGNYRMRQHNGGKTYFSSEHSDNDFGMFIVSTGLAWTTINQNNVTNTTFNTASGASFGVQNGGASTAETFAGIISQTVPGAALINTGAILQNESSSINMGLYDDGVFVHDMGVRASATVPLNGIIDGVIGGNFSAGRSNDTNAIINGFVAGIHAEGVLRQTVGESIQLIGGIFRTRDLTPATNPELRHIAILVPASDNEGIVVINADTISGNNRAQLEVTGNIETFGVGNGIIVDDEVNGNKYKINTSGGGINITLV
jgi:hypothetical protein